MAVMVSMIMRMVVVMVSAAEQKGAGQIHCRSMQAIHVAVPKATVVG